MIRTAVFAAAALTLVALAGTANAASFNCYAAKSHTEAVICDNQRLSDLDTQMSISYFSLLNSLHGYQRARLQNDQVRWLGWRNGCQANIGCLFRVYNQRISRLNGGY